MVEGEKNSQGVLTPFHPIDPFETFADCSAFVMLLLGLDISYDPRQVLRAKAHYSVTDLPLKGLAELV